MIIVSLDVLEIPTGISVIAIDKQFFIHPRDDNYYFDFLRDIPYHGQKSTSKDGITFYDITLIKLKAKIENIKEDFIILERTDKCEPIRFRNKIYSKESPYIIHGVRGDNITIKVYSNDPGDYPLCEWVVSNKQPQVQFIAKK